MLVIATYRLKIVALACLVTVTKINGATGRIEHVVVHEKYRGKGLSKLMMTRLITFAYQKKLRYLDLTTSTDRIIANALYRKLGFQKRNSNPYRLTLDK